MDAGDVLSPLLSQKIGAWSVFHIRLYNAQVYLFPGVKPLVEIKLTPTHGSVVHIEKCRHMKPMCRRLYLIANFKPLW